MLHRLTDLLNRGLRVGDETLEANEAWFDPDGGRLQYVGVDIGGWLSDRTALVSSALVTWDGARYVADISRKGVEEGAIEPEGGFRLSLDALPPVMTGPFGNTISPMLIGAGLRAEAEEEGPPRPPAPEPEGSGAPTAEEKLRRLETWTELHGASVFARDGEVGPLADLVLDDMLWEPVQLLVLRGEGAVAVPFDKVRRRVDAGGHFVVAGEVDELTAA